MTPPIEFDLSIDSVDDAKRITGKLTENEREYLLDALQSSASAWENSSQWKESNESSVQDSSENIEEGRVMTDFIDIPNSNKYSLFSKDGDLYKIILDREIYDIVFDYVDNMQYPIAKDSTKNEILKYIWNVFISELRDSYKEKGYLHSAVWFSACKRKINELPEDSNGFNKKLKLALKYGNDEDNTLKLLLNWRDKIKDFIIKKRKERRDSWSIKDNILKKLFYLNSIVCEMPEINKKELEMLEWSDKEKANLLYTNLLHNNLNRHMDILLDYIKSQENYKENLQLNYADELWVPKDFQFDIKKDIELDWKEIKILAQWFFKYKKEIDAFKWTDLSMHSKGKYIVGEKDGKKYFIYDTGISEHRFIAEKYGIDKVLWWWWLILEKDGIEVKDKSKFYGEDPYQESGFTKRVFENLLNK